MRIKWDNIVVYIHKNWGDREGNNAIKFDDHIIYQINLAVQRLAIFFGMKLTEFYPFSVKSTLMIRINRRLVKIYYGIHSLTKTSVNPYHIDERFAQLHTMFMSNRSMGIILTRI